jgi:hypothetical protein
MTKRAVSSTSLVLLALAGCGGDPAPSTDAGRDAASLADAPAIDAVVIDAGRDAGPSRAPLFRNELTTPDAELAREALRLMGAEEAGGSGSCRDCHGITRQSIAQMREVSDAAWSSCFTDLEVTTPAAAQAIVACFQDARDEYTTHNLGVFATGTQNAWFEYVFRLAFGATADAELAAFRMRVQQPPAPRPAFTQAEFDVIAEWFLRGTPQVDSVLPPLDGPGECTSYVSPAVATLVAEGERSGWSARNTEAGILMHGCAGAASPLDCLATYPRASETSYGARWETAGTHQRVLFDVPYNTSYWTKSSADGRFVAHGGNGAGAGGSIIDLQRGVVIGVDGAYDPGFYPDNSGFMFQGTPRGTGTCAQSVLTTGMPTRIRFSEVGCSSSDVGLYQHLGASLDGGDYWVVNSVWSGDPGDELSDPQVFADPSSRTTLLRFTNTGSGASFEPAGDVSAATAWEGNAVISPTMRMLVTQLARASGEPLGYVLRGIELTRDASGAVTSVELPELARYCLPGGKAAISLDDRWIVTHHRATNADATDLGFTGPSDPGFAAYRGVSNVYLIDVLTGREIRVTNMQPGQRALFPHFRSDGWLYFLVRDRTLPERIVASDAGLVLR